MKYYVIMRVNGRFTCEVEAESLEDAKTKAGDAYSDADFGALECIDADFVTAEDSNGDYHDFN